MQGFKKYIELFSEEKYRDLNYGTIYYVPGNSSQQLDEYANAHAEEISTRINGDENSWITCHIICLDKDNPFFAPRQNAAFYSAMMPSKFYSEKCFNFFRASLNISEPSKIEEAFYQYFRTLQQMFDEILEDGNFHTFHMLQTVLSPLEDEIRFSVTGFEMHFEPKRICVSGTLDMPCEEEEKVEHFDYPSRLEITPDTFQVLLPDYHREIKFNAQIKALYVLFLNHPEGIRMAEIGDHKEEYKQLYLYFTNRSDTDQLKNAVERLFDVYSPNALNVKKSQCSLALRMAIPEDHLRQYYEIEVHRGEPHKINLDRSLVSMPDFLHQNSL